MIIVPLKKENIEKRLKNLRKFEKTGTVKGYGRGIFQPSVKRQAVKRYYIQSPGEKSKTPSVQYSDFISCIFPYISFRFLPIQ
jgi:hypothetical protein